MDSYMQTSTEVMGPKTPEDQGPSEVLRVKVESSKGHSEVEARPIKSEATCSQGGGQGGGQYFQNTRTHRYSGNLFFL